MKYMEPQHKAGARAELSLGCVLRLITVVTNIYRETPVLVQEPTGFPVTVTPILYSYVTAGARF